MSRIGIFLPSLAGGGAERMILHLSRGFVEMGHSVDLVLARAEGPYMTEVPKDVEIKELHAPKAPIYAALGSLRPLVSYLRSNKPDTLLSAMTRINIVTVLATKLSRTDTQVVVSERNHLSSYIANNPGMGMKMLPYLARFTYPLADGIIPISNGVADDLSETTGLPRDEMDVIYNPVVIPEMNEKSRRAVSHPWFTDEETDVILGVGSLTRQKDFPTLIRAYANLKSQRNVRLVILGEGPQRDQIRKLAKSLGVDDDLWLPGFVDNPYKYMSGADVFVLSSRWEGFGNVIVEAMSCGTPVVSTDCPSGPSEILDNGKYGPLVPVEDPESLATAIGSVLSEPTSTQELQQRAKSFEYKQVAGEYLKVLLN